MSPDQVVQFLITGLALGSIYALVALGFTLIFNATGIVNMAQGEFVMLGGISAATLAGRFSLPLPLAVVAGILGAAAIGGLMELLTIHPLRGASSFRLILITLGVAIFFQAAALIVFGHDPLHLAPFSGDRPLRLLGATLLPQVLWIWGWLAIVVIGLQIFYRRSRWGRAMLACSINPEAAAAVGIDVRRIVLLSFVLAAALGGLGGVLIAPIASVSYRVGVLWSLKGFGAAVFGGMGSASGALVGGLALGVFEALSTGFLSSGYRDAFTLGALILVLILRPQGLLRGRIT